MTHPPATKSETKAKPAPPAAATGWTPGARTLAALVVMWAGVLAVYFPLRQHPAENAMVGADFMNLHSARMRFAREALFGPRPHLPAWYPRELLGTPFWSNVQNFPFLPTRLALLTLDPLTAWPVGVNLAALLAATFTYGYCRRIGLNRPASAAAGWTFAAAGYFAARVTAGHLPLLEAYPALPLLLWLVEVIVAPRPGETEAIDPATIQPATSAPAAASDRRLPLKLLALGVASACFALAGHPQLPLYSFVVAGLYLLYRGWRRRRGQVIAAAAATALGIGCAAFALVPMALLIGRSTRLLPLKRAANDIIFPYHRLGSFVLPWKDGWPENLPTETSRPFTGPAPGDFFDTVCYVGIAPLAAVVLLTVIALLRRRRPREPWPFFAAVGIAALVTALPLLQQWIARLPGTLVRSPSRQLYVTTFALALALGAAVDLAWRYRWAALLATLALAAHFVDLWSHDRVFIWTFAIDDTRGGPLERQVRAVVGDGRAAIDYSLPLPFNREFDDVGFFDSIMLARPYAAILDLTGAPPDLNTQQGKGSSFNRRTLESTGVKVVVTSRAPPGQAISDETRVYVYGVAKPLPRAQFFPASDALLLDRAQVHDRLRDPGYSLGTHVMLHPGDAGVVGSATQSSATTAPAAPAAAQYRRDDSDRITVTISPDRPGFLRVLESWDPGWRALVDGVPVTPVPADDVFLCVPIGPGSHRVVFEYSTPGAAAGACLSAASAVGLALLTLLAWKRQAVRVGAGATRA
jgi:hypothetical protein